MLGLAIATAGRAHAAGCTYTLSPTTTTAGSAGGGGSITMTAGSTCAWTAASTNSWIHTTSTGKGNGTITYTVDANLAYSSRTGAVTAGGKTTVITQSAAPVSLGVALNNTNLVFVTSTQYPWYATNPPAPTFDGVYSAVSGNRFVPSSSSWLQTTLVGPGTLSFWWRVDSDVTPPPPAVPYSFDELEVDINGVMQDQIMGQVDWNFRTYDVPAGTNVVTWQYVKDAQYNAGSDQGWLDEITYTTNAPIGLAQALDTCGVNWTSGGNTNPTYWSGETNITHSGVSAAQSGSIGPNQESWVQTTVVGVTNLSFWWKVSSQTNYDYYEFYTNSVRATRISGEVNWQSNFFRLTGTTNQLKWRFVRTNLVVVAQGQESAWLDQVVIKPAPKPQVVFYATNVVLGTTGTNCQGVLPDLTGPAYVTVANNCSVTVTQSPPAGTMLSLGQQLSVVETVRDAAGDTTLVTNSVLVVDSTPPQLILLGANPSTTECHAPFIDPGATASDSCSGVLTLTTNVLGDPNTTGAYAIQYIATDTAGNTATNTRTVHVVDTQPPVIALNGANPMVLECHSGFADPGATAMDACAGPVSVEVTGAVDPNAPGTYTLTYSATDPAGNLGSATRTVNVVDTAPPSVTLNGANPLVIECHSTFADPGATAVDACAGPVSVRVTGAVNPNAPGTYTLTYSATDPAGNPGSTTRTVKVVDTMPPVVALNGANPMVLECHSTFSDPGATASDVCAGAVSVSVTGSVNPNAPGSYTLTYTATDPSGNVGTATRTINVVDSMPPVVTLNGANPLMVECRSTFSDPGATAEDLCAGSVSVLVSGAVNANALGSYTLTYSATDPSGNVGTATRTVRVVDTTPPEITQPVPAQTLATATSNCTATLPNLVPLLGAADNFSSSLNIIEVPPAGTPLPLGSTNVTFFVDDGNGNTNISSTLVTVADQLPVITAQPQCQTNCVGSPVTFSVAASACTSLSYQWCGGSGPLAGQTNSALVLPAVSLSDAGSYTVLVTGSGGSVTSIVAQLTVTNKALVPATMQAGQVVENGFQFSFSGPAGQTYRVLATSDLTAPKNTWAVLTNGTFSSGPVIFVDTSAATIPQRFYSIASP
jgi:hypothetical protein